MRKSIIALSLAAAWTAAANAETKTFDVDGFDKIQVSSGLDVYFEAGEDTSVSAEQRDGNWDDLEVSVRGDTLVLKRPRRSGFSWGRRPSYSITVSAPIVSELSVHAGSDVEGKGMSGETVIISTSSGSEAEVEDIEAENVELEASSGSDLTVSGTCLNVEAKSSSGADIEADELICETAKASASSGSDIELFASVRLVASASSGADIDVEGSPTDVNVEKSSGGSVDVEKVN